MKHFLRTLRGVFGSKTDDVAESHKRVVVTGIGVVSPIGIGVEQFWQNLLNGETGVDRIQQLDADGFPSQIAAEVRNFSPEKYLSKRQIRHFPRVTQFALTAFQLAKQDALVADFDTFRTDVILGSATCALAEVDKQVFANPTAGRKWLKGTFDSSVLGRIFTNGPACAIALSENIQGHVTTLSSACASSVNAVGLAYERILDGRADVAITGGADCGVNYFSLNSFCAANALSTDNENPQSALCPFDRRRTKSVLGEAAAIFILESLEHALMRDARVYGEICSFKQNYENTNELYLLDTSGLRWSQTISAAAEQNKAIDLIVAHAPSDTTIDEVEAKALKHAIGEARLRDIPVSSIKGSTGSPLGAAGGLQLAAGLMAIKTGQLPPTRNFVEPDPLVCLDVVARARRCAHIRNVLVNTHGFGGVNASLYLHKSLL